VPKKPVFFAGLWTLLCVLSASAPMSVAECSAPPRTVTVNATVRDDAGQPVTGVVIVVSCGTEKKAAAALTDAQGHTDISLTIAESTRTLYVAIEPMSSLLGDADNAVADQNYTLKIKSKSVNVPQMIAVVESQADYASSFSLKRSSSISGRLVDNAGNPVGGYLERRGSRLPVVAKDSDGLFVVKDVPRGEACEMLVTSSSGGPRRSVSPRPRTRPQPQDGGSSRRPRASIVTPCAARSRRAASDRISPI